MKNGMIKFIVLTTALMFILNGYLDTDSSKWLSKANTVAEEASNLSVDWNENNYVNDFIGFEMKIPETWDKAAPNELNVEGFLSNS